MRCTAVLNTSHHEGSRLSPRHIFQDRNRASRKRSGTANGESPSVFGAMQRQATGQMSGPDANGLFLRLSEQKAKIESAQTEKSFVASIHTVKAMAMTVLHTS